MRAEQYKRKYEVAEVCTGNMKYFFVFSLGLAIAIGISTSAQMMNTKTPEMRREELTAERELLKHVDKEYGVVCYEGYNCVKI